MSDIDQIGTGYVVTVKLMRRRESCETLEELCDRACQELQASNMGLYLITEVRDEGQTLRLDPMTGEYLST